MTIVTASLTIPQIYIAAIVTNILALVMIGGGLYFRTPPKERVKERALFILLVLLTLPMCALAFHVVRLPVDHWLDGFLAKKEDLVAFIRVLYAPSTEEPAKLWPVLIPWIYRRITSQNYLRVAIALGLGFGLGEAWTVAGFLANNPVIAKYPWYQLNGFIGERFLVCLLHACFTGAALYWIIIRRRVVVGIGCAMLLHFFGNFPIYLAQQDFLKFGKSVWQVLLTFWVPAYLLLLIAALSFLAYGKGWLEKIIGKTTCPECHAVYAPLFGVNLFHKSYERCPACKHWHLVETWNRSRN